MRLIDAVDLRREVAKAPWCLTTILGLIDAAPTVDVPQPLTRDGVLAEVARIEAAGDTAVVELLWTAPGVWEELAPTHLKQWENPDVPRWNVRVRAVPAETEDVPLTQLVGRTIKGETEAVYQWWPFEDDKYAWCPDAMQRSRTIPVDLATGLVTVLAKGEA